MAGSTQAERDLERVIEFRNRLVAYMNVVLEHGENFRWNGVEPEVARRVGGEQPWLSQEYGRLHAVINRFGIMRMGSPALGITSHDVVTDAISNPAAISYDDISRLAVQHLDTAIGKLGGEAEERERQHARAAEARARSVTDAARWYRVTSPLYWLARVGHLLGWIVGTKGGRTSGIIGALALAVVGGLVSGVAQGWFEAVFVR